MVIVESQTALLKAYSTMQQIAQLNYLALRRDDDRRALFVASVIAKMVPGLREEDKRLWESFQWHVLLEELEQQDELNTLYDDLQNPGNKTATIDIDDSVSFE